MKYSTTDYGRPLGILLVTLSAGAFALAGVLTKSISSDNWTVACWRGLIGGLLIAAYVLWRRNGASARESLRLGWRGWLLATVGAVASTAFIAAFKLTYIANVAIMYATAPFVAAALEWLILGQAARGQTMAAAGISFLGIAIMVGSGAGAVNLAGDAVAVLMTGLSALYMVLIRTFRDTPVVWAGAVSGFQLFVLGWFVTDPLAVSQDDAVLLVLFGGVWALALILWTEGTRLIPAAEAGLLGSAEVPLAVLFAWLILTELPPSASFIGGAVVLAAVFAHAARDLMAKPNGEIR